MCALHEHAESQSWCRDRLEPEQIDGKEEALREDFRKLLKHKDFKLRLSAANLAQRQELCDRRVSAIVGKGRAQIAQAA